MTGFAEPYRALLAIRPYRRFWLGSLTSVIGDEITRTALIWFVYEKTGSAASVGLLLAAFTGPIVVGSFAAGWALDRFERTRVMMLDSLFRAAVVASVPLLFLAGALELWHVYAVALTHGFLMMIPLAGTPSVLPALVPKPRLATANALEVLGYTLGAVIGPAIAGSLIATVGAPLALALDVASYLVFALSLRRLHGATPPPRMAGGAKASLKDVLRLAFGHPVLLATTLMFLFYNVGNGLAGVWLPVLADEWLKGGAGLYGTLLSAIAAGQVMSSVAAGAIAERIPLGRSIALAQMTAGLVFGLIAWVAMPAAAAAAVLGLYGAAAAPLTIWAQTLRLAIIPAEMRGRAFALLRMLMQSGRPLGGGLGSLLLPHLGLAPAILVSMLLIALPGGLGLLVKPLREAGRPGARSA